MRESEREKGEKAYKWKEGRERMWLGQEEGQAMAGVILLGAKSVLRWNINEHNEED